MSATGLATFDTTVQESNLWLKSIMHRLGTGDRQLAYIALRATLHALRDRIGPENAVHLGAQLPMLLRGLYYDGWHVAGTPTRERHKLDFLDHIRQELGGRFDMDPEAAARAVFETMWAHIDLGEIAKVMNVLPKEVRELWQCVGNERSETAMRR